MVIFDVLLQFLGFYTAASASFVFKAIGYFIGLALAR
jgi:hypothetical protein